jgi:hypothetical protein
MLTDVSEFEKKDRAVRQLWQTASALIQILNQSVTFHNKHPVCLKVLIDIESTNALRISLYVMLSQTHICLSASESNVITEY